jgi:hypothetical protein
MQSLFEKLQLKDEKNLLIQGLPSSIEKQFLKLYYSKNVTPLLKSRGIDFALIFVINQQQMCNILKEVFPALHTQSKLWVAYPRSSSKIVSDLNRECKWQMLSENEYETVEEIVLDHVWSAMRFRKPENLSTRYRAFSEVKKSDMKGVDFDKRLVVAPIELETLFVKHKKVKELFTSLSSTNQKEYVSWIESAKKAETKQRRSEVVVEKLLSGKRNLSEK